MSSLSSSPVVLHSTAEIRKRVAHILNGEPGERRVALVAFVGRRPLEIADRVDGLEVVCWPAPGVTSAEGVRDLVAARASVRFATRMHRKVYWSANRGALVGSANFTLGALGPNANSEACVYFPNSSDVPIDVLLSDLAPDTESFDERLAELEAADEPADHYGAVRKRAPSFAEWCAQWGAGDKGGLKPPRWKLGAWDEELDFSKEARRVSKERFRREEPDSFISAPKKSTFLERDWILTVRIVGSKLSELEWLRVQYVVRVSKGDKVAYDKEYPYQAVQAVKCRPTLAPFDLSSRAEVHAALKRLVLGKPERLLKVVDVLGMDSEILRGAFTA